MDSGASQQSSPTRTLSRHVGSAPLIGRARFEPQGIATWPLALGRRLLRHAQRTLILAQSLHEVEFHSTESFRLMLGQTYAYARLRLTLGPS